MAKDAETRVVGALDELSPREREIAALVVRGMSDLNIAAQLAIKEVTVGSHLNRIYKKLGVHSRVELASRWWGTRGT